MSVRTLTTILWIWAAVDLKINSKALLIKSWKHASFSIIVEKAFWGFNWDRVDIINKFSFYRIELLVLGRAGLVNIAKPEVASSAIILWG